MKIFRAVHDKNNPFVMVSKEALCPLSLEERGFLIYLLAKPDDWGFRPREMAKELSVHRATVYRLLKRMIDLRYVERHDIKAVSPMGLIRQSSVYIIHELPIPEDKDVRINGEEIPF